MKFTLYFNCIVSCRQICHIFFDECLVQQRNIVFVINDTAILIQHHPVCDNILVDDLCAGSELIGYMEILKSTDAVPLCECVFHALCVGEALITYRPAVSGREIDQNILELTVRSVRQLIDNFFTDPFYRIFFQK